jgi:predicted RNase H-like HicB family nuclease
MSKPRYSMMINWSEEDRVYVVCLPEFGAGAKTHGRTYTEAARRGQELIETLTGIAEEDGTPLPPPLVFDSETNFAPNPFKSRSLTAELRPRRPYAEIRP